MFPNNLNTIANIKQGIFRLSEKNSQQAYSDLIYDHLTDLVKFKLLGAEDYNNNINLNQKIYLGLEQYVFEHTENIEKSHPKEINWDIIDDEKDLLKKTIKKTLRHEATSEHLKPIIDFTVNSYENWLIYNQLHPESSANPWIPTNSIFVGNGYLFLISGEEDIISSYNKDIYSKSDENSSKLCIIATGKPNSTRNFSGFQIDNRNNLQKIVFNYLKSQKTGANRTLSINKIAFHLNEKGYIYTYNYIKNKVLLPLKRAGLIGVISSGYFVISNENDLISTYKYHKEKLYGIQKTIDIYEEKAQQMGFDLDNVKHGLLF